MNELLSLCDSHGQTLPGSISPDALDSRPEGSFVRACDVWFADGQGRLLLRAVQPGLWGGISGFIRADESPEAGCIRTCQGALSLAPDMNRGGLVMGYCGDQVFHDVWLLRQDISPDAPEDARWFTVQELRGMLCRSEIAPVGYWEQLLIMLPVLCAC